MQRFSSSDRLFSVVLWAVAVIAGLIWFAPERAPWRPLMDALAFLVAAAVLVNLYRFWRACAQLRRRD